MSTTMIRALALIPLVGCSLAPDEKVGSITFVPVRSMSGELPIAGVDSDREGGLWIAYQVHGGDYYDNDETRVVHLDASGAKTKEFIYTDEYTDVRGVAFSGDAVWINYNAQSGNRHVRKLDPNTGDRIGSFALQNGIVDLDVHNDELRLSYQWNQIIALDLTTGGERWRAPVTAFGDGGTQRGLASLDDGRMWVASWVTGQIYLLGPDGGVIDSGGSEHLEHGLTVGVGLHLAWDGTYLLMVVDGQIHWLEPQL
jgi:hypothetical protein